jgi:hypothetical protein
MMRRTIGVMSGVLLAGLALGGSVRAQAIGWDIQKIALGGELVSATGGTRANGFLSVALSNAGEVVYLNELQGGAAGWAAFRLAAYGEEIVFLEGDPAPSGGTYVFASGLARTNDLRDVTLMAIVSGGSASTGIFRDAAGTESAAALPGNTAPGTGGGSYAGSPNGWSLHDLNATGSIAFVSDVIGGSAASGVFIESPGSAAAVALEGETAPGTGGVYAGFDSAALSDGGVVVFPALVSGGSHTSGLFRVAGGSGSALALVGEPAPDTGGGSFADFLYPVVNDAGSVLFLSNVSGATAGGGIFLHVAGALQAVAVEGDVAPGSGGATYAVVPGLPDLNAGGDVVFASALLGGSVSAGVFLYDGSSTQVEPVVLSEQAAPDADGASFMAFDLVATNDARQVAFQAELSDGRRGLFLATPSGVGVPALPPGGFALLFVLLAATALPLISRAARR